MIDGVHPNETGYTLIADAIDGTVVKLLQEAEFTANRPIPVPAPPKVKAESIVTTQTPAPVSANLNEGILIPPVPAPLEPATGIVTTSATTKPKTSASELITVASS